MTTETARVSVAAAGEPRRADALLVFPLDGKRELAAPESAPEAAFLANAERIFSNAKVNKPVAAHGTADSPSMLALHRRSVLHHPAPEAIRILAARALAHARNFSLPEVVFSLTGPDGPEFAGPAAEGAALGSYRFRRYFRSAGGSPPAARILVEAGEAAAARAAVERSVGLAVEVNRARDLVNEPAEALTPETLAEEARRIASRTALEVEVFEEDRLRECGYAGLLSVGQGSPRPPRLIILRHRPRSDASGPHLALLGKGITFDTGGISLKPPRRMWEMKGDMSGAAAVLRAMSAVSRAGLPATVTGIVAAAENFPGPNATRPGDIFRAKNGKSVMVDSTDAEGRLVLTDALARAGEEGATHIVDIATLTGAAVRALGPGVAAILGNDSAWVGAVTAAGGEHGEVYWELPLVDEYRVELECDSADLKNIGGFNAGTITAALFLREFVPEDAIWAHLDIAGPFLVTKPWKYFPKGATGFGVRTLYETAARFPSP